MKSGISNLSLQSSASWQWTLVLHWEDQVCTNWFDQLRTKVKEKRIQRTFRLFVRTLTLLLQLFKWAMPSEILSIQPDEFTFPCKFVLINIHESMCFCQEILFMYPFSLNCFWWNCLPVFVLYGTVELRKEIPCSVQLLNLTDNLVAFKAHYFSFTLSL